MRKGNCSAVSVTVNIILFTALICETQAYQIGNNPLRRGERLDPEGKYLLEWEVDWTRERVTFNVTVETRSWVGFGLSNNGTIQAGADMVIGGVGPKGRAYFSDRHIIQRGDIPIWDRQQDWTLHSAWESRTHTFLSFSRAFDTCDPQDYALTPNKITLIWSYGRSDNEDGHDPENRGIFHTHLLDPDYSPEIIRDPITTDPILLTANRNENVPEDTKVWSLHTSLTLSTNDTEYICTYHKAPRLRRTHHWIGFDIHFPNEESRLHTHHMMFFRCHAPRGQNAQDIFQPLLTSPGETCFSVTRQLADVTSPRQFCSEVFFEWAIGAKTFFMPEHVGVPFGESVDEYYMLQFHYDNPEMRRGIQVETRLDFFYTSQLRPNDGAILALTHDIPGLPESQLVPPNSRGHRVFTHCSPPCTRRMYPPTGITVTAVSLHSHNAGMRMRLRHFRGDRELPWISYDDNYDNWVQPFRNLRREVKVMPGDQLTLGTKTVEKMPLFHQYDFCCWWFTRYNEMCNAFLLHHQRIKDYSFCRSSIISEEGRQRFLGVGNVSWIQDELEWIVQTPPRLAGLKVTEVSDSFVNWTPARRDELQRFHDTQPHTGSCVQDFHTRRLEELDELPVTPIGVPWPGPLNTPEEYIGPVSYPFEATPYVPPGSTCRRSRIG